jgi:hypothetical protein
MFRVTQFTLFALLLLCVGIGGSGCAYLKDRGNDALDTFTVAGGVGGGAKVRIGFLQTGFLMNLDELGMRYGKFFKGWGDGGHPTLDIDFLVSRAEDSALPHDARGKEYSSGGGIAVEDIVGDNSWAYGYWIFSGVDRDDAKRYAERVNEVNGFYFPHPHYTAIEVCAGWGGTLRLGVNPGELLDFILGWTTLDIYGDDINSEGEKKQTLGMESAKLGKAGEKIDGAD